MDPSGSRWSLDTSVRCVRSLPLAFGSPVLDILDKLSTANERVIKRDRW